MKSQNEYIGDDSFKKMLDHYHCPTPLHVIKMRFAGAICSPNLELRPTEVISSFWPQGETPRLETKNEAELFFKFFMGLWDTIFVGVKNNHIKLDRLEGKDKATLKAYCHHRYEEVEAGFIEGFWGGKADLKITQYIAGIIDSLTDLSEVYAKMPNKIDSAMDLTAITSALHKTDEMVEKSIRFIIENSVLQRIEELRRSVN